MFNNHAHFGIENWPPLVSPADVAIIVIVALLVFGPKKPAQLLTELGQGLRELREMTRKK